MGLKGSVVGTLLLALLLPVATAARSEFVSVPVIENGVASLRVAHAMNPRLPSLNDQELQTLLSVMSQTVAEHFGIRLELGPIVDTNVNDLISAIPDAAIQVRKDQIYDFKNGTGDRQRLLRGYEKTLRSWKTPLDELIAYANPHLTTPVADRTYPGLAEALVSIHLARLDIWRKRRAADGKPELDESNANEWIFWDLLGYSNIPFDLIITNQPVISAEYEDSGLNSALRGGVSAGGTSFSKSGRYKTLAFISTFPFAEFESLPEGTSDINSRAQAVHLAGQYTAHEIGHMLMLLAHPFGNPACVMRPEPLFRFASWAKHLDANKCRIGSSPAMQPGAAQIQYRPDW